MLEFDCGSGAAGSEDVWVADGEVEPENDGPEALGAVPGGGGSLDPGVHCGGTHSLDADELVVKPRRTRRTFKLKPPCRRAGEAPRRSATSDGRYLRLLLRQVPACEASGRAQSRS